MRFRYPLKRILRRERNVLIGFSLLTVILYLVLPDYWIYGLYLYGLHLLTMTVFYNCKKTD